MNINLIGKSFDKDSGQGIYRYSGEILNHLNRYKDITVKINDKGDINHVQQPELIWKALFKKNVITTIHDLIPLICKERKLSFRIFFYFSVLLSCIKSKKIITVSKCTKKDLEKYFPFCKKKVEIIYEGVNKKEFFPTNKKKKNPYFIIGYTGGLGKRKNVEFILKLAKLLEKNKKIIFKIGGKGPEKDKLEKIVKKEGIKNVKFVGFIPPNQLNNFYNSLDLFIFPSLYEGFGLPVLEAMACGTVVISSNISSLPEIIGKGGGSICLNLNLKDFKEKINKFIKMKKKDLKILKEKSYQKTKKFTWEKSTNKLIKVYKGLK
jgi:glycosyltransferase involved in cell wall biosynthesis